MLLVGENHCMQYTGEIAALATALLWSFTAICFSEAGKLIGSFAVNKIRLVFAIVIYATILMFTVGSPIPQGLTTQHWFWLTLSGVIGLVLGDGCGFKALVMIGPRLMTLIAASTPIWTTLIAWIFLGEHLRTHNLVGIAITVSGITWVVLERRDSSRNSIHLEHPDAGTLTKGVLLALGAAICQATGLVLSKQGMLHAGAPVAPLVASYTRMLGSTVLIWTMSGLRGKLPETVGHVTNRRAMLFTLAGALFGPFLGIWMSLVAVSRIEAGIAATLNSITPILIIPTVILFYGEKVTMRAIIGALVAVSGVAVLFLS